MKPSVLLVDDDSEFTELIQFNLERQNCRLRVAPNGAEGLRLANEETPDVILLDLMLPDIPGLMLCRILNQHPSTRDVPIFILSALVPSWFEAAQHARFARFFQKPVAMKILAESIITVCSNKPKDSTKSAPRPESTQAEPNGIAHSHATANSSGAHPHSGHRGKAL